VFEKKQVHIRVSAPAEKMFSQAACLITKQRNRLSDDIFDELTVAEHKLYVCWFDWNSRTVGLGL